MITVSADVTGLAAGANIATLTINDPAAVNNPPKTISITFTVTPVGGGGSSGGGGGGCLLSNGTAHWLAFLLIGAGVAAAYRPVAQYWKKRNQPVWRTAEVKRGRIVADVNSTGKIKPVLSVQVGSFVSGPRAHRKRARSNSGETVMAVEMQALPGPETAPHSAISDSEVRGDHSNDNAPLARPDAAV